MRDITIGQYYPVESIVHSLDPRTKLMSAFLYIVALFLVKNPLWYLLFLLHHTASVHFLLQDGGDTGRGAG